MAFFERYEKMCRLRGLEPCSQKAAEALNTTRANISAWKRGTKPNIERLRDAADYVKTSADYLIGRTDDMTDFISVQTKGTYIPKNIAEMVARLDDRDLDKVTAYLQGILSQDKYQKRSYDPTDCK